MPYSLMWLSDMECPHIEDVGLGIGSLKVRGNTPFSIPLCPAVSGLPAAKDPIRSIWVPHGESPAGTDCFDRDDLEIVKRCWFPYVLETTYCFQKTEVIQRTTVFKAGAQAELSFERTVKNFILSGKSFGACKLWYEKGCLIVIESSVELRPLGYVIRLDPPPDDLSLFPSTDLDVLKAGAVFPEPCRWEFCWRHCSKLAMEVHIDRDGMTKIPEPRGNFSIRLEEKKSSWEDYYDRQVPAVQTPDQRVNHIADYLAYVFRANGIRLGGLLPHPFSMPKQTFSGFWMWDCCFHAIAGRWYGQRNLVWGNLLNIENLQYDARLSSGGVIANQAQPYGVNMFETDQATSSRRLVMPHLIPEQHGDGTHPPTFSQALEAVWETDKNERYLRRLLPHAVAYHDWFERKRSSQRFPGLLYVRRWSDSGMDNSKRWGGQGTSIYGATVDMDACTWALPIVAVEVNVGSVLEKYSLSRLLTVVGDYKQASQLRQEAEEREARIHRFLWNPKTEFYEDRTEQDGQFIPVWTPVLFYPLLLNSIPASRIIRLKSILFDKRHFWTQAPLPSLAVSDADFRPEHSYWMGCTWMNYNIYILRALFRRDPSSGWKLLDRVLDMLMPHGTPNVFENYNPLTGLGYDAANFGWHGMLVDVIIQELLGIQPSGDTLNVVTGHCPVDWPEWDVDNLFYCGKRYHIHSWQKNGVWNTSVMEKESQS